MAEDGLSKKQAEYFTIKTLGCKVNQSESETLSIQLQQTGLKESSDKKPENKTDLYIINTCAVTGKAAMQSRQAIRQALRSNPNAKIIVTGCYAQTEPDEIKTIKGIHCVLGQDKKQHITNIILSELKQNVGYKKKNYNIEKTALLKKTRPFLKIQDGCNSFCTYCIVPYARGRSKSLPLKAVVDHIREYKTAGYHELVLTGVHLGMYGLDLSPETNLYNLLKLIDKHSEINMGIRIRLSSIEPREITDDIVKLVSKSDIFCKHFHIPLQSGDDYILKKMNRPYSGYFFKEKVLKIKRLIPDAAIGADVLTGFPGESEKAFENTFDLINQLPLSYLHVFPFSPRKRTPAAKYPDKIKPSVIKERCKVLRELSIHKKRKFYKSFIGKTLTALIEGTRTKTGLLKGITSNYIPVLLNGKDNLINTLAQVNIQKLNSDNNAMDASVIETQKKNMPELL